LNLFAFKIFYLEKGLEKKTEKKKKEKRKPSRTPSLHSAQPLSGLLTPPPWPINGGPVGQLTCAPSPSLAV